MRFVKVKYNYNSNTNDYKTPPAIYEMALKYLNIDKFTLDACCSDKHIPSYLHFIKGKNDGLEEHWATYTWCNPPYNECEKWVTKAYYEVEKGYCAIAVLLLPVRTETKYWHKYILNNSNCQIQLLRKGYRFLNKSDVEMGVFKNALALVYFTQEKQETRLFT